MQVQWNKIENQANNSIDSSASTFGSGALDFAKSIIDGVGSKYVTPEEYYKDDGNEAVQSQIAMWEKNKALQDQLYQERQDHLNQKEQWLNTYGNTEPNSFTTGSNPNEQEMINNFIAYGRKQGMSDNDIGDALGLISAESGFKPRMEMNYTGQNLIDFKYGRRGDGYKTFRERLSKFSDEDLYTLAKNPEKMFNVLYDNRNGNGVGEGYKYRGSGLLGLTGKANYAAVGKMVGIDLVNNPELANDPKYALPVAYATAKLSGLFGKSQTEKIRKLAGSSNIDSKDKRLLAMNKFRTLVKNTNRG